MESKEAMLVAQGLFCHFFSILPQCASACTGMKPSTLFLFNLLNQTETLLLA